MHAYTGGKRRAPGPLLLLAATIVAGLGLPAPAPAQECEVPLFVKQGSVDANVMILFDNSGSMNEAMYHADYNPNMVYRGAGGSTSLRFDPETIYYATADGLRSARSFIGTLPSTPTAYLVNSDGGQNGRYYGNYLNWIYFNATAAQRDAIPRVTRVQVAKMVTTDIIKRSRNVRFGLTRFNNDAGGTIVANCGADTVTLRRAVNLLSATTWTPTGESMENILTYFKGTGATRPILQPCQYNFLIVMTDGFPTYDQNVSAYLRDADHDGRDPGNCASLGAPYPETNNCSDYMDDVAYYMRHNDLRTDTAMPGDQTVITYTVGFGIDGGILRETAVNGDGMYLLASNATELWLSLSRIMQDIVTKISSGSAVAVVSTERGDNDRLYRGKFMPGLWRGFLEAFDLPYEAGESAAWEAGALLADRNPSSRNIFTFFDGQRRDWDASNSALLARAMGFGDADSAAYMIQWTRGNMMGGKRERDGWVLGDIIHSTPVVVGAPSYFNTDPDYQTFMQANRDRPRTIYVGANDGMLHAFSAESGEELWAFVPQFALPKLKAIADTSYCHTYTVDLTPAIRDVKIGDTWKTVLVGGGREGGSAYFALDVTDPSAPIVMWETDLAGYGDSWSEAEFARVDNRQVVLVGSGLDETTRRAWLSAIDLETGDQLGHILLSTAASGRNMATTPRAVDIDFDGATDVVYVGDLVGNMWRFGLADDSDPASWSLTRLFSAGRPITGQPTAAFADETTLLVYFGTGAYLTDADLLTTDLNSFYCIRDDGTGRSYTRTDLADQTTDPDNSIGDASGWLVDLWGGTGERVTERAVVVANNVYFTTFAPSGLACQAGGTSWFYHLHYSNGGAPEVDDAFADSPTADRSEELGEGVASRPVVDIVNENIIVQSSNATIAVQDIGQAIFHLTVRSWQENFDGATQSAETPLP
ncbi:MAG: pilus assembly protein [Candidatus Krumholzibacteriia bacterium]